MIGRGGMGTVYLAAQERLDAWVALKVIRHGTAPQEAAVARFEREAKAVAALRGKTPHVVHVYDYGWDREAAGYYITMEFVDGESLGDIRRRAERLPPGQAVGAVLQAARALDVAHGLGLVHRDIKPDNLLLTTDGTVKVADFGLVRRVDGTDEMTATGQALGTATFMAPEQAMGEKVDHRADLYSLGATLFDLVTGHPPHQVRGGVALFETLMHLATAPVPDLAIDGAVVDAELDAISKRLLAKRPDDRYPTAAEAVADLEAWSAAHGGPAQLAGLAQARPLPAPVPATAPDPFADTHARAAQGASVESEPPIDLVIPSAASSHGDGGGGASLVATIAAPILVAAVVGGTLWATLGNGSPPAPSPAAAPGPAPATAQPPTHAPPATAEPAPAPVAAPQPAPAPGPTPPSGPTPAERITELLIEVEKLERDRAYGAALNVLNRAYGVDPMDERLNPARKRIEKLKNDSDTARTKREAFDRLMQEAYQRQAVAANGAEWGAVRKLAQRAEDTAPDQDAAKTARELKQVASDHLTWESAKTAEQQGDLEGALRLATAAFQTGEAPPELVEMRVRVAQKIAAVDARARFHAIVTGLPSEPSSDWPADKLKKQLTAAESAAAGLPEPEAAAKLAQLERVEAVHRVTVALESARSLLAAKSYATARATLDALLDPALPGHAIVAPLWRQAIEGEGRMSIELGDGVQIHFVLIKGPNQGQVFWMGRTEVTQGQWKALTGNNPATYRSERGWQLRPVESVSWTQSTAWCESLNARMHAVHRRFWRAELPSQALWMHAAQAGASTTDPRGLHGKPISLLAWHDGNSEKQTHQVATLQANPWGLHDVFGNVWEWCRDRDPKTAEPLIAGGSFGTKPHEAGADRFSHAPENTTFRIIGLRVMLRER